ncbi:hypothetical protein NC651_034013 [Populus alba x Populus x berolinensis]|nr:hypothetical protein NC651_034013 [Populus alba x Populus x berolinensis]
MSAANFDVRVDDGSGICLMFVHALLSTVNTASLLSRASIWRLKDWNAALYGDGS